MYIEDFNTIYLSFIK